MQLPKIPAKHRLYVYVGLVIFILLIIAIRFKHKIQENKTLITYTVAQDIFEISVTSTGELESENSTQIFTPSDVLQSIEIWDINLARILPEGTIVDSGTLVAELDPSKLSEKLLDINNSLQNAYTLIENAKSDTSFELMSIRNELQNQKFTIQEMELNLKQSIYEPPSVIRQAEMNVEKAKREYDQKLTNYELKRQKGIMLINQARIQYNFFENRKLKIMEAFNRINIKSPGKGMLVYQKDFEGKPIKSGSTIQIQANRILASIPDFSSMKSTTFVNEIDISRIKAGQKVIIGIDAFPDKKYNGRVIQIANMGEELRGSNTKVFRVIIRLDSTDSFLKPGMTTSNKIIINTFPDKVYIPLEAIHTSENINYVFLRRGLKTRKQQVVPGEMNDNFIVIDKGLEKGDEVLLSIPDNSGNLRLFKL